ncbi:hypothetical protein TNIN_6171, partial [Trichonephila inaurata madagascariensis]
MLFVLFEVIAGHSPVVTFIAFLPVRVILPDHVRCLLSNHDDGGIGVTGHKSWHDGSVHHSEVLNAFNPEKEIQTCKELFL